MVKKLRPFLILSGKFLGILFGFTFLAISLSIIYARALDQGRFIKWQKLSQPPVRAEKLLTPDYIMSSSGVIYKHSSDPFSPPESCGADCWYQIEEVPSNESDDLLPLSDCGWLPNLEKYSDFVAKCEKFGPGGTLTRILARDKNDSFYSWTNPRGEGNVYIAVYGMIFRTILGFFVGLVVATKVVKRYCRKRESAD